MELAAADLNGDPSKIEAHLCAAHPEFTASLGITDLLQRAALDDLARNCRVVDAKAGDPVFFQNES